MKLDENDLFTPKKKNSQFYDVNSNEKLNLKNKNNSEENCKN